MLGMAISALPVSYTHLSLGAGEDGLVDLRAQLVTVGEDEAAARAAQGLEMCIRDRSCRPLR